MRTMLPPRGWAILRRDGYYYPAAILAEKPRRYAFLYSNGHLYRSKQRLTAYGYAVNYISGFMIEAEFSPLGDASDFTLIAENPNGKPHP